MADSNFDWSNYAQNQLDEKTFYDAALAAMQKMQLELVAEPMAQDDRERVIEQAGRDAIASMVSAAQTGLTQQQNAQQALQSSQGGVQSAANAQSDEALKAMNLAAALQGPADWIKQMQAIRGLNQAGVTGSVAALGSAYRTPGTQGLQAPAAGPQTLGTLTDKFAKTGGWEGGLTPTQLAMLGALNTQQAAQQMGPGGKYGASVTSDIDKAISAMMGQNQSFANLPMGNYTDASGKMTTTPWLAPQGAPAPVSTQYVAPTPLPPSPSMTIAHPSGATATWY